MDGYSERERGEWLGVKRTCSGCQRETIEHLEDGECCQCRAKDDADLRERLEDERRTRRAQAIRKLMESLPEYLRAKGHPERAAVWEERLRHG